MVNLNSLYKGLPWKVINYFDYNYITPSGEKIILTNNNYLFCNISKSKKLRLIRSPYTLDTIPKLLVSPLTRYQNIFEYVREKNVKQGRIFDLREDFYTQGQFGYAKQFFPTESVIEFFLFNNLYKDIKDVKTYVISESLFEFLFEEVES